MSWIRSLRVRPQALFPGLLLLCLGAFLITLLLPRVDGQLIGSDGVGYYVYLPSLLLDADLDFRDEYEHFLAHDPRVVEAAVAARTSNGLPANRLGIGPAVLWTPFFLCGHAVATVLSWIGLTLSLDGTSYLYQAFVLASSPIYGALGAWLSFLAARRLGLGEWPCCFAALLVVLAGNPIYYLTIEPSMSHAPSLLSSSAFFYLWIRGRTGESGSRLQWCHRLALGAVAGAMALVRPQDGLFLLLPIADEAIDSWRLSGRAWASWAWRSGVMAGAALLTFAPQLVIWKLLNGGFAQSGYVSGSGPLFGFASPRIVDVLISARRGLLFWHPVFLLALLGLVCLSRRHPRLSRLVAAGFLIQLWLVASWHDWAQGDAFGGRMFISCTPIFVLGLSALSEDLVRRWSWKPLLLTGGALTALNLLLVLQYRLELLSVPQPSFGDLTWGRIAFLFRLL